MKSEIRVVGFDDAPFEKLNKGKKTLIVGTIFRGGSFLDGVLSTKAAIDGSNSTSKLIEAINKCKFKPQLQCILLDGISFGGFNIIDIERLNKETNIPVVVVVRKNPDIKNIKRILDRIGKKSKIKLIERAGVPVRIGNIYVQFKGIELNKVKEVLRITCTRSFIPEPIRAAHLIAAGVVKGESRGKA